VTHASHENRAILVALGTVVRRIREEHGLTRSEVARRADLRRDYVRAIERGGANPRFVVLDRLARKGLGIRVADLLEAVLQEMGESGECANPSRSNAQRP
jgi:transcriptional regulator with XRE-family HTH domain